MENASVDYDDWRAKLGRSLRDCRDRLGWSQKKLAEEASRVLYPNNKKKGISPSTIHLVEHGANTTIEMVNALTIAMDVEVRVRLRPRDESGPEQTKPEPAPPAPSASTVSPEQVRRLLADIPPPVDDNGEMDTSDATARLARLGEELVRVIEDLQARGQTSMARRPGSARPAKPRSDRGRSHRERRQKASPKR